MPSDQYSKPVQLIRASAGSGKTFLLTVEYLKLLFRHPFKYREILAVTFTNKATEEMKMRILQELRTLALGKASTHKTRLLEEFPELADGDALAMQADLLYRTILHDYAKFSVSTIDSFVQQVVRSFAFEIGLDAGFELQLNQDLVKQDLSRRLFALVETNDDLLHWMKDIVQTRMDEGKPWDFNNEMLELASEIFKERFYRFEQNMRSLENPAASFTALRLRLKTLIDNTEKQMVAYGEQGIALIAGAGLQQEDFKGKKNGFTNYFYKLAAKDGFDPNKTTVEAQDNLPGWTTATTPADIKNKVADLYPQLNRVLVSAIAFYQTNAVEYNTAVTVFQQLSNLNLIRVMAEQLADYRRENNVLLLSDTQQLLRELVQDNDAPFIYEKIGNRFQHFLLDEFQDTSNYQWANFKPLLEQSIATAQRNLVVGDVKQSIYRWRNGDWRLLQEQVKKDLGAYNVEESGLHENYRSRKQIIDFNNYIFHHTPQLLQAEFNNRMADVESAAITEKLVSQGYLNIIQEDYADSKQEAPATALEGGMIELRFLEGADARKSSSWRVEADQRLGPLIESLLRDKGFDPAQITILARGNNDCRHIISQLLLYQQTEENSTQYGVVSAEALLVINSPAIQLLLAALHWLVNPKNNLALAELVQANAIRLNLPLDNIEWYRTESNHALEQLPDAFRQKKKFLLQSGLYTCVEELIRIFSLDEWVSEQAYILAFRDLVNTQSQKGKTDLRDFLNWWTEEGVDKALPVLAAANAVQVMTIHKSKGLAFDVVILPYADWNIDPFKGLLWCEWPDAPAGFSVVPVNLRSKLAATNFAFDYFEELLMCRMDALNMLYVALTRARQALYIMAPQPTESKTEKNKLTHIGDLLWQAMNRQLNGIPVEITDFSQKFESNGLLVEGKISAATSLKNEEGQLTLQAFTSSLDLFTDLRELSSQEILLRSAPNEQQRMGQLAHLALSRIGPGQSAELVLQKMEIEGLLNPQQKADVLQKLQQAMENPLLAEWFGEKYTALNEKAILLKGGALRRPDKVLVGAEETILLDFKFTQETNSAHGRQLQEYQEILQSMGYRHIRAYVYYGFNQSLVPLAQLSRRQGDLFV